jgi:hypothetical protein
VTSAMGEASLNPVFELAIVDVRTGAHRMACDVGRRP